MGRLAKLAAVKSLHRNMKTEDEVYKDDIDIHQRELWGDGAKPKGDAGKPGSEEDMEIMAAGDVQFVHHHHHAKPDEPKPQPQTPKESSQMSPMKAALIGGALALGSGGLGFVASQLLQPSSTTIEHAADLREFEVGLLPPDTPGEKQ